MSNTQMHGAGTFVDVRMNDAARSPAGVQSKTDDVRGREDRITPKLAALRLYQLAIPAPTPPKDSFGAAAAKRGAGLFAGKARCARCHVPPPFTEPGWSMHTAEGLGIDDFQASRTPDEKYYRTTPLRGLFARSKPGFYHDGRFADLGVVVDHYQRHFGLDPSASDRTGLIEYLELL